MVDFQSRDTRRGPDIDQEDDEQEEDDQTADAEEPAVDAGGDDNAGQRARESEGDAEREDEGVTETGGTDADTDVPAEDVGYAVVTVAAGRSREDDATGEGVVDAVESAGGGVATRELIAPSYDGVQTAVGALVDRSDVDAVVTVGGTGVEPTDVTVDAVEDILDKHLPGFGELFRVLSHDHEGTAIVRTRATAGIVDGVPVFCLPGDPAAALRGVEGIVLEEAATLVAEASEVPDDGSAE